eukprot:6761344-Prymnesium_polylepis.1
MAARTSWKPSELQRPGQSILLCRSDSSPSNLAAHCFNLHVHVRSGCSLLSPGLRCLRCIWGGGGEGESPPLLEVWHRYVAIRFTGWGIPGWT